MRDTPSGRSGEAVSLERSVMDGACAGQHAFDSTPTRWSARSADDLSDSRQKDGQKGESLMLQRLLTLKFGPLDTATQARLAAADSEMLLVWGERVLTAGSLAEVFGEAP